jgi:hypothetical protein
LGKEVVNPHYGSVAFCLGHDDQKDYTNPTIIEDLARYRVIEAACGESFTVISCSQGLNSFYNKNMHDFQDTLTHNIKDRVKQSKIVQATL